MAYLVITQLGPTFEPALISKATAHCKQQDNYTQKTTIFSYNSTDTVTNVAFET